MTPRRFAAVCLVAASAVAGASASRQPLPASLIAAESHAEDVVDAALAHDRGRVTAIATELRATANAQAAGLHARGVPRVLVTKLEQRADRLAALARTGSYVRILLAPNAVSALMPALYAHFADPVPPAIQTLDYLDREALFRSLAGQPVRVAAAVKELGWTWGRVRPKVLAAGGGSRAAAYARHVAAMKRLDPAARARIQAEARHGLELVDRLEQSFG